MLYIAISIMLILAFQGYQREKSFVNFQTIFCLMWCAVCCAASFRLYEMINFSDDIYIIFVIGCIGFSVGCNCIKPSIRILNYDNIYNISRSTFNILYYSTAIFMVYFTIKVLFVLNSGVPYSVIREMWGYSSEYYEGAFMTNRYEIFMRTFVLTPLIPVFNGMLLLHILKVIKLKKIDVIKILILSVLYIFVSGSRIVITNLILQGLLMVFLLKIRLQKKYLKRIFLGVVLMIVAISVISENRERERSLVEWNVNHTYYSYLALPVPMCYYHIERADRMDYRSHGLSFAKGVVSLALFPLSIIGIPRPDTFMKMEEFYEGVSEYVSIFYGTQNNAYVSLFFYFYLDFGLFGVFLGSLLYGLFLSRLYKRTVKQCNLRNLLLLLVAIISLAKCFAKWEFQGAEYIMSFVYVLILVRKMPFLTRQNTLI